MTVGLFLAIFLLIMIRMLVSVYKLRPIEMLRSENVGENRRRQTGSLHLRER